MVPSLVENISKKKPTTNTNHNKPMKTKTFITAAVLATAMHASAAVISFSDAFTDDASTGINSLNTYTHTVSGGSAQTVNGVSFDLLNSTTTPANFSWTSSTGGEAQLTNFPNSWDPATGGVTGTDTIDLLTDFAFAGGPSNSQNFTLSGLNIGQDYETRIYIRQFSDGGRPIDFDFTNGAELDSTSFDEDKPTDLGYANDDNAYYLSYSFTAQATSLSIDAAVVDPSEGGFHLYALSNQFVPEPSSTALLGLGGVALMLRRRRK